MRVLGTIPVRASLGTIPKLRPVGDGSKFAPCNVFLEFFYIYIYSFMQNTQKQTESRKSRRSLIRKRRANTLQIQRIRAAINFSLGPFKASLGGRFQNLELWRTRI